MTADGTHNEDARFGFLMNDARRGRCAEDPNWTERAFPTAYGSIASVKMGARSKEQKSSTSLRGRAGRGGKGSLMNVQRPQSETGREEIAVIVMLAPGKGVPFSEQIVSAPEA